MERFDRLTRTQQVLLVIVGFAFVVSDIGRFLIFVVLWLAWEILTLGILWNLVMVAAIIWFVRWGKPWLRRKVGKVGIVRLEARRAARLLRRRRAALRRRLVWLMHRLRFR